MFFTPIARIMTNYYAQIQRDMTEISGEFLILQNITTNNFAPLQENIFDTNCINYNS